MALHPIAQFFDRIQKTPGYKNYGRPALKGTGLVVGGLLVWEIVCQSQIRLAIIRAREAMGSGYYSAALLYLKPHQLKFKLQKEGCALSINAANGAKQYDYAIETGEVCALQGFKGIELVLGVATAFAEKNDPGTALQILESNVANFKDSWELPTLAARILNKVKQYGQALKVYDRVLELRKNDKEVLREILAVVGPSMQWEALRPYVDKALAVKDADPELKLWCALVLINGEVKSDDVKKAEQLVQEVKAELSSKAEVLAALKRRFESLLGGEKPKKLPVERK